ncbi:flavodoxin FldA [Blochmannia endosymbiont of Camponotus sp.]|uniref:flavodoxin FldA n=1 Tax=Blochmannia endosymbiont of Camponotus sp. TaxID=700220 RepID=UPI00202489FE|nr:flavodoxin FldA [Blochmannia endosymbiont of Camponotus sp.]URJ31046.1 flavodoxin FldA [Blochmannia endosymbiont of Camponotus sp.]
MIAASVGIFFSSDTGNTEKLAKMIRAQLGQDVADVFDIAVSSKEDIEHYDKLLFGIPTWYYGEPQCDWDDFLPTLRNIDFSGKKVAIFGCGDQEDYSEYFCDAMSILYDIILKNGAIVIGSWPASGYHFNTSKSLISADTFVGLAIDEDRQPEMTEIRVKHWVNQIRGEMKIN